MTAVERKPRPRAGFFDAPKDEPKHRRLLRYWGQDVAQGMLDLALHYAMRAMPIAWCSALGGWLGELTGRYRFKLSAQRARANYVRFGGGARSEAELDATMRGYWNHVGRVMSEFSVIDRFWRAGRLSVAGQDHLAAARTRGPVLVMGVHVGNWEAVEPVLIELGCAASMIYQPPRNRFQHWIAVKARHRCGIGVLAPGIGSTREAFRILRRRDGVLLVHVDEYVRGRVNAPLFGRAANHRSNLTLVARLALTTGATIVPAVTERTNGARFRVQFQPPVALDGDADDAASLAIAVARLDRIVEAWVGTHLDQWLMLMDLRPDRP